MPMAPPPGLPSAPRVPPAPAPPGGSGVEEERPLEVEESALAVNHILSNTSDTVKVSEGC